MRASDSRRFRSTPSTAGILTRMVCARIAHAGMDCDPLLAKAGLSADQIGDPAATVSARSQIEFAELAAEALGDDLMGFRLARDFDFRDTGLTHYVLSSSPTVEAALRNAGRYSSIVNEAVSLEIDLAREIVIVLRYVDVVRRSERHQIEFWMAGLVRMLRQITGSDVRPVRVAMAHLRTGTPPEMRTFFGREVEFGAALDELTFAESVKSMPVVTADHRLNALLVGFCEEIMSRRSPRRATAGALVEAAVAPLLSQGRLSPREVARRLGMSERTLARRLAEEGTTFFRVTDGMKARIAQDHLVGDELPVSEIAALLGYRSASSFVHAVRRWTGRTPTDLRAEAVRLRTVAPDRPRRRRD